MSDLLDHLYERLEDCDCPVDNMCPKCKETLEIINELIEDEEL
jgi:hypothetical protein